jgi:transposase-like protein
VPIEDPNTTHGRGLLAMACPVCRARRIVEIGLTLKGSQITMHSCSKCDTRWWDTDGEKVSLDHVFDLAAPTT